MPKRKNKKKKNNSKAPVKNTNIENDLKKDVLEEKEETKEKEEINKEEKKEILQNKKLSIQKKVEEETHQVEEQENRHKEMQEERREVSPQEKIEEDELNDFKEKDIGMESNEIKSRAVVKYSVPRPPEYVKLQCNTDLNLPPANWLSSSADSYGLQKAFTLTQKGFASFRMAQLYPDCVGDVDVISDAENIKKLLKIPYSNNVISMFVHRVGNTLLIDNFDIYKNFTRSDGLFSWLRDFVLEHLSNKALQNERRLYVQDRSREALKHRSLVSKFMYHSLDMKQSERMIQNEVNQTHSSRSVEYPVLPNPSPEVEAPDPSFDDKYNRNVVWTFEDIEMLLGTDMPIFGGGEYPCISLRLRDMQQPINILTGIDYWLDNLMSNVPEVVMCYHLNGFVQKYELIKTEDLPQLKNSKFSPQLIKDVAQNILSFLKTNATKAGHTYWLFKDKGEEVIKLYDLTCLVPQNDKLQNPFTIPVAMLLYRVARNFMKSKRKKTGIIKMLLENCVKLLPESKYPEIVTSSYFMLSEIYLPITTNPEAPKFDIEDQDRDSFESDDDDSNEDAIKFLDLDNTEYKNNKNTFKPPPPIEGDADYRSLNALGYVQRGLNCLKYFSDESSEAMPMGSGISTAKSSEPIPMGYEKLNVNKKDDASTNTPQKACEVENNATVEPQKDGVAKMNGNDQDKKSDEKGVVHKGSKSKKKKSKRQEIPSLVVINNKNTEPLPTWKQKNVRQDGMSWKTHLKILLYEKAVLVFATLSEYYFGQQEYDNCFRNLRLLAKCSLIMRKLRGSIQFNEGCLLGRAGDCCIRIFLKSQESALSLQTFCTNIVTHTSIESEMLTQIMNDEDNHDPEYKANLMCVFDCDFDTPGHVINSAVLCYEEALKVSATDSMKKRLANALNEAGTFYLNYAKSFFGSELGGWARKAEGYLLRSEEIFENIKDKENIALLNTNLGHMHRLLAYSYSQPGNPLTNEEQEHFSKSHDYFQKAIVALGKRQTNPVIWDNVNWEFSTSLYTEACLMQEYPPKHLSFEEYSEAVLMALSLALKVCDQNPEHSKFNLYKQRMAFLKYRIAVVHHNRFLKTEEPAMQKKLVTLAEVEYTVAAQYFNESMMPLCYLKTHMKLMTLYQVYSKKLTNPRSTLEYLYACLHLTCVSHGMLENIMYNKVTINDKEHVLPNDEDCCHTLDGVVDLFMQKFQLVLFDIIKFYGADKNPHNGLSDLYKKCYKEALNYTLKPHSNKLKKALEVLDIVMKLMQSQDYRKKE